MRAEFLSIAGDYRQVRFKAWPRDGEWRRRRSSRLALRTRLGNLRDLDFGNRLWQSRGDGFPVIEGPAGNDAGMSVRPQRFRINVDDAVLANLSLQQAEQLHTG